MLIVTTSDKFTDIDSLACAIAYGEYLSLTGKENKVVLPGIFNQSITSLVRKFVNQFDRKYKDDPSEDEFILVDISEKEYFAKFVNIRNVIKVFDHRAGFEDYWKEKIGENAVIEKVGSCATLIFEEFKKSGFLNKISRNSSALLYTSIISNSLNLKASITTKRDIQAAKTLFRISGLSSDYKMKYFNEVSESIFSNLRKALKNDTKEMDINSKKFYISQLELWDAKDFINQNKDTILKFLNRFLPAYNFLTVANISKGHNYIITPDLKTQNILTGILKIKFHNSIALTKKLWLRKEILERLIQLTRSS